MLNYTDKYINLLAVLITVLIFVTIVFLDLLKFQNNYYKPNNMILKEASTMKLNATEIKIKADAHNIQTYRNSYLSKDIKSETIYMEMARIANGLGKKTEEIELELGKEKTEEENKERSLSKINETGKIDIYSTNKWRIKIPKLRLDAPISEGTTQEAMRRTVGHFTQTDKWKGNVALAAHNRGYKCNFFQEIKKLQKGDTIIYSTEKGQRTYQVTINKIIEETDWTYIQDTKDNRITLITCETDKREYRRCIQAVEVT